VSAMNVPVTIFVLKRLRRDITELLVRVIKIFAIVKYGAGNCRIIGPWDWGNWREMFKTVVIDVEVIIILGRLDKVFWMKRISAELQMIKA
jgi:hypothetical protein